MPKLVFGGLALIGLVLMEWRIAANIFQLPEAKHEPVTVPAVTPPPQPMPAAPGPEPPGTVAANPPPATPPVTAVSPGNPPTDPETAAIPPHLPEVPIKPVSSVKTLDTVQHVYIAPAPDGFDAILRKQLTDEFKGKLDFASTLASADGVLTVILADEKGHQVSGASGDRSQLKGSQHAIATLRDPAGKLELWTADVNDHAALGFGDRSKRMASRIASKLRKDMVK